MSPRQRVGGSHLQSGGECRQIKRPKRGPVIGLGAKYFNTDSNFKGLATGQRPSVSVSVTFTLGILLLKWEAEAEAELTLAAREGEKFIVAVVALSSLIVRP